MAENKTQTAASPASTRTPKELSSELLDQMAEKVTSEIDLTSRYAHEKSERKAQLFKLSITIFTGFVAAFIAVFGTLKGSVPAASKDVFEILVTALLCAYALINFAIVKQYAENHVAIIFSAQQVNLLRQLSDCILYAAVEGQWPSDALNSLRNNETVYWTVFGRRRVVQIENDGLLRRERKFVFASDGFTIVVMTLLSASALALPLIYFATQSPHGWAAYAAAAIIGLFAVLTGILVFEVQKRVTKKLVDDIERTSVDASALKYTLTFVEPAKPKGV